MEQLISAVQPYLPYLLYALPFIVGLVVLAIRGQLDDFAKQAIGAAYKVAITEATALQHEGMEWLRSEQGADYRKLLASRAYDALPAVLYGVPIGLIKAVVSRDAFCAAVERAFQQVAELACEIKFPEELP